MGSWKGLGDYHVSSAYVRAARQQDPSRLCPNIDSPAGRLAFVGPSRDGAPGPRMTVLDAMRACRCENNPLDQFMQGAPWGAFGGSSCELSSRLQCLQEASDDIGRPPSAACLRQLRDDNAQLLNERYRECAIVNCGPDAMINDDCGCTQISDARQSPFQNFGLCDQIRCPDGMFPSPSAGGCVCREIVDFRGRDGNGRNIPQPCGPNVPIDECLRGLQNSR